MSAYGAINTPQRPVEPLPSTIWHIPTKQTDTAISSKRDYLTIHHLTLQTALTHPDLVPYFYVSFADELERGMTYPQEILQGETYTQATFEGYFFAADVLVAIIGQDRVFAEGKQDGSQVGITLDEARNGRTWTESIAGFYYVSSSLCMTISRIFAFSQGSVNAPG